MIALTRRDGSRFWLNVHQIETLEATPDTVVTLLSGRKFVVKDSVDQIVAAAVAYRRRLGLMQTQESDPPTADRRELNEEKRHGG